MGIPGDTVLFSPSPEGDGAEVCGIVRRTYAAELPQQRRRIIE